MSARLIARAKDAASSSDGIRARNLVISWGVFGVLMGVPPIDPSPQELPDLLCGDVRVSPGGLLPCPGMRACCRRCTRWRMT